MKKVSIFLIVFCLLTVFTVSFADEVATDSATSEGEDIAFIDNYGELMDIFASGEEEQQEEENPLKATYDTYREYLLSYYDEFERPTTYKAQITKAGDVKEDYYQQDYYSVSKYVLQPVTIQILEGPYKDTEKEIDYILTTDTLNNIVMAPARVGDVLFVTVDDSGNGELNISVPNSWSAMSRFRVVVVLAIIAILLLLIYAGKRGLGIAFSAIIAILLTVVVITTFTFNNIASVWFGVLAILLISFIINIMHLGFNKAMFKSWFVSIIMILVAWLMLYVSNLAACMVGMSFEFAAIAENVIIGGIDFGNLYYVITLVIASGAIANTVAMSVNRMQRENVESFEDKLEVCRPAIITNVILLAVTIFALYIPNHLLLLTNKFQIKEILNSETFVSELVRFLVLTISITLSVPVASINAWGFGKKYLKAPKNESVDSEKNKEYFLKNDANKENEQNNVQ